MRVAAVEVVEDRTEKSRCDEGFLKVVRLILRNRYEDGSTSPAYPCDVVSRPGSDAVVALLYERDGGGIRVALRESLRPPLYLRRYKTFVQPDPRPYNSLHEVVAGLVEGSDGAGDVGLHRRASAEADEEAGLGVPPDRFTTLGGETFASPGTSDEKLYYCAAPARLEDAREPRGDGSVMEAGATVHAVGLGEAIARCRSGSIPDMKTEVGLLRLAEHLGYLPNLDCFEHELPEDLRRRYRTLGVARGTAAGEGA
jgi:ADP-ribose diphosphatase